MPVVSLPSALRRPFSVLFSRPSKLPWAPYIPPYHRCGRFINPWDTTASQRTMASALWRMFRCHLSSRFQDVQLPRMEPDWDTIRNPPASIDQALLTWIGHSSFLIQIGGLNILTDPIFSERASPSQRLGPRRIVPIPGGSLRNLIGALPKIDVVLISHNHYDHLCSTTVDALHLAFRPTFFVPVGVGSWMQRRDIHNVTELDWWQKSMSLLPGLLQMEVIGLPVQHLTSRSLFDRGMTLCLSYMMRFRTPGAIRSIYFAGDTGYRQVPESFQNDEDQLSTNPIFRQIAAGFGPVDLSLIPIGAYSPRWFMSPMHLSPEDAICVHRDLQSRQSIGMHWGTFFLTEEPADEPPRRLQQAISRSGLDPKEFSVMTHGETKAVALQKDAVGQYERVSEAPQIRLETSQQIEI